jgi:hypothetical protein
MMVCFSFFAAWQLEAELAEVKERRFGALHV